MLDTLPDDIILIIINQLGYLDKTRLSIINKHLLTIFNKYNISDDTVLDITYDDIISSDWSFNKDKYNHKKDFYKKINSCLKKFPNIKIHLSNNYYLSKRFHNNIYSYNYNIRFKNKKVLNYVLKCPNLKNLIINNRDMHYDITSHYLNINFSNYKMLNLNKLELINCDIDDISLLGNINDLTLKFCDVKILPKEFNNKYLSFYSCSFLNNENISIIKNTYKLSIEFCDNITDLSCLKTNIKELILNNNNNNILRYTRLDNLEYLYIHSVNNLDYLGENIKKLCISSSILNNLPKIKYLEELEIFNSDININLDKMDNLKKIKIYYNRHINELFDIKNITSLTIKRCTLLNINSLCNIETMDLIDITCCDLPDISPLKNMKHINKLILLECNNLSDITPLKNIISINSLKLSYSLDISDFSPLSNIKIKNLYVSHCNVDKDNLKYFNNLELLDISYIKYKMSKSELNEYIINNNILEIKTEYF